MSMSSTMFLVVLILIVNLIQFIQVQEFNCTLTDTNDKGICYNDPNNTICPNFELSFLSVTPCNPDDRRVLCCPFKEQFRVTGKRARAMCHFYHTDYYGYPGYNGIAARSKEFPHMAALGYINGNFITWGCGGTLISKDFVLTAAHCLYSPDFGPVKIARLGDLDLNSESDDATPIDFPVLQTIPHPKYKRPSHYHDIGLIRIPNVTFNLVYKPACLHTYHNIPYRGEFTATGWGKTSFIGGENSKLLKVKLNLVPLEKCKRRYALVSTRRLDHGIDDHIQLCAGHPDGNDPCPGDSGGPFQIAVTKADVKNTKYHFEVIGITSFGKGCGQEDSVGVYTRIAPYIRWIEDIVWPI